MLVETNGLALLAETYFPCNEIASNLRHITLVPIIGPVAIGKSARIDGVVELDDQFGRVQSFTTRLQRPGEDSDHFRFLPRTQSTIDHIYNEVKNGLLVQFAVHPTTGDVYGTEKNDYGRPFMFIDIMASGVESLRSLPFATISEVSLVADTESWLKRLVARKMTSQETKKRLLEGCASLSWSLDQGSEMTWVDNSDGFAYQATQDLRSIALGIEVHNPKNRKVGESLLRFLQAML